MYDLAESMAESDNIIQLRDHHRSFLDIIQFSNQEFYDNTLRIATDYSRLQSPNDSNDAKPILGRLGSAEPLPSDYRWWERLLIKTKLMKPRATLIPSERLQKYADRLKYLDEVVSRAEDARLSIYARLNTFSPSDTELRFVDVCDRCDSLQRQVDQLRRLVNTSIK